MAEEAGAGAAATNKHESALADQQTKSNEAILVLVQEHDELDEQMKTKDAANAELTGQAQAMEAKMRELVARCKSMYEQGKSLQAKNTRLQDQLKQGQQQ